MADTTAQRAPTQGEAEAVGGEVLKLLAVLDVRARAVERATGATPLATLRRIESAHQDARNALIIAIAERIGRPQQIAATEVE